MTPLLEIEIDDDFNHDLIFPPLGRKVRGRADAARSVKRDKGAASLAVEWSQPIPGQRLGFDADTGEGYLLEPLYRDEYTVTRERIQAKRFKLEPELTRFPADKATWLYWLKAAVESGHARVTAGELPETIEGEPKLSFITTRQKDPQTRLAEAVEKQTEMMGKLLAELVGSKKR